VATALLISVRYSIMWIEKEINRGEKERGRNNFIIRFQQQEGSQEMPENTWKINAIMHTEKRVSIPIPIAIAHETKLK
jgi:hypothetical protein